MFDAIDEVLEKWLVRDIPIRNKEIDIKFDQPKREWSARLNRPTINLYLYDLRENRKLRGSEQWLVTQNKDGTVSQRRAPVRVDLFYLITVWADDPADEHSLLASILLTLMRQPFLPKDLLPESLQRQPAPISIQVAQEDTLANLSDIWSVMDNEERPAIMLTLTVALDPYLPFVTRMVRSREIRFGQAAAPQEAQQLVETGISGSYWTVGGTLHSQIPLQELKLILAEQGKVIPVSEDGRFTIGRLRSGTYTLEAHLGEKMLKQYALTVPAPDFDFTV
ncbi:MAG TPA: DUF4255 domain-containing protein [Anaerolineaceae bacterium]